MKLILVKHSLPHLIPDTPANQWGLAEMGQERAEGLVAQLAPYQPLRVVTSIEPKAAQTAQILAQGLGLTAELLAGLHEHDRNAIGWVTKERLEQGVADFYRFGDQVVFGDETAHNAYDRFAAAIETLTAQAAPEQEGAIVVVTHGTVLSLYVSRTTGTDPFALWQRLGLPSYVVLSLPDWQLLTVVDHI